MKGHVDAYGRALIAMSIRSPHGASSDKIEAWIDTGFISYRLRHVTID